ncbi:MFS transporter [Ferrovibrio sp.]|uniref:MFS transporter n=1 Tax=Ferrovibrio sp. TaxID=1917215 RepID=UPI0035135FF1
MPASVASAALSPQSLLPGLGLALAVCLTQFDVTAIAVALPALRAEFGFGLAGAAWVMDAYSLGFVAMLFLAGAMADRFGRRRLLLAGNVVFALASLACGLAWDGPSLWLARGLQGGAAAFVVTGGYAALSAAYPADDPARRARAFGIIGIVGGSAMALGPTLGGLIADAAGWRWIFFVNLPVCAIADPIVRFATGESRDPDGRPLDLPGILLLTLALMLPVQALLHADGPSWQRWAALGAGLAAAAMLARQQGRLARPMLDPALFARRGTIGVAAVLLALSLGYWAQLIYLPMFLQAAYGLAADRTGLAMLAATLPMVLLPPLGAPLVLRLGWRAGLAAGLLLLAAGMAALGLLAGLQAPLSLSLAAMVLGACGAGLIHAQAGSAMVTQAPPGQGGMAAAVTVTLRQGGHAVGIALLGAVLADRSGLAAGFAPGFLLAAAAAALGALAAVVLIPSAGKRED